MTNQRCRELIEEKGVDRNPLTGIVGSYYTTERERDLRELAIAILKERKRKNMSKHIKVIGGTKEQNEDGVGKNKKTWSVFIEKKTVVVEERNLAALFRRDSYLCGLPVIKLIPTRERCTPGLIFSEFPAY